MVEMHLIKNIIANCRLIHEDAPVLAKAANYYDDQVKMTGMRFGWGKAQRHFFENWLKQAEENRLKKVCTQ